MYSITDFINCDVIVSYSTRKEIKELISVAMSEHGVGDSGVSGAACFVNLRDKNIWHYHDTRSASGFCKSEFAKTPAIINIKDLLLCDVVDTIETKNLFLDKIMLF